MRLQMRFGRRRETGLLAVLAAVSVSLSHGLLPPAMLAPARIAGPESVVNRASRLQLASSMGVRRGRRGRMRISASTLTVSGDVPNDPTSSSASEYMALLAKMPVASYQYNTVSTQSSKGGEEHIHKVQSHITPWMRSGELNAPGAFKPPPRQPSSTLQQSSTLLRGAAAGYGSSNSDAALRGIRVGDGIRCRSRVAVGHGIASRSRMDILGQGAGSIGRTGALPALLSKLYRATLNTVKSPARHINLDLSKSYIQRIREEVSASYQEGQRAMTQMGHLLTKALTPGAHECRSTVCAELWESPLDADGAEGAQEKTLTRFSLSQSVAPDQVQTHDSLALAQEQLEGLVVKTAGEWRGARVVDHSLVFDILECNAFGIIRIVMHAKPSSELGQLIVDSMFGIDYQELGAESLGADHDPHMYQIQVLAETEDQAKEIHFRLRNIAFADDHLRQLGVPGTPKTRQFELVSQSHSTLTTQVVWCGTGIMIQVQSLDAHLMASELSVMEERAREVQRRQAVLDEIQRRAPIVQFSRDFIKWTLESDVDRPPPSCPQVSVSVSGGDGVGVSASIGKVADGDAGGDEVAVWEADGDGEHGEAFGEAAGCNSLNLFVQHGDELLHELGEASIEDPKP